MSEHKIRIATRKSPLALWQAEEVGRRLQALHPGLEIELLRMVTQGDKVLDSPLSKIGGKGLFVKELEQGLLEGRADIAVHSMKDVPMELPEGLHLPVILEREDPRDAFVSNRYAGIEALPADARVGTASLRRECQLRSRMPGLRILNLRGNVNTRLAKLDDDEFDAIILAASGLKRLGFEARIAQRIDTAISLPAAGQGAIGVECRAGDERVEQLIQGLDHAPTRHRVRAERAMNTRLNGGCQVPIGGYAEIEGETLYLRGLVGRPDGGLIHRAEARAPLAEAESLGTTVAEDLLAQGADRILADLGLQPTA